MSEISNNYLNDVPLSPDAIISDDRVTVGQLRQALDRLDDGTEVVIPITLFGVQVDQFEVSAVMITEDRKRVGIVAAMRNEFAEAIAKDMVQPAGTGDNEAEPEVKPFA
jgi:hypothetical protein